jgi:MscS family membrane protein
MDTFLDFVFLGNPLKQWITAAAFIAGGFIAGYICSRIMSGIFKRLSKKTKHRLDDILVAVLEKPIAILVFLGGLSLGINRLSLGEPVQLWAGRILDILFISVITRALSRMINSVIRQYVPAKSTGVLGAKETEIQPILRKFFDIIIWIIAGALILKTLGYNISALMAGLGLGGAAIALASKDTLANFFGSITVFVDRPFKFNERIKIAGYDGYITEMGLRTSRLRTLENRTVIIPNSIFAANPIENVSAEPSVKVTQTIAVKRDNGIEKINQAIALLREIGGTVPGTFSQSASQVPGAAGVAQAALVTVSGVSCQITYIYYVAKDADYYATVNAVNLEVLRSFETAGIVLG